MAIRWTDSADKHGIDREDALNAILHQIYHVEQFDEPRVDTGARPDLYIGPTRDRRKMLEVMAVITPPNDILVFHVMEARRKILDIAERGTQNEHEEGQGRPHRGTGPAGAGPL